MAAQATRLYIELTNGDFKFHRIVSGVNHGGREESSKKFVLATSEKIGHTVLVYNLHFLYFGGGEFPQGHVYLHHHTPPIRHTFNLEGGVREDVREDVRGRM